MVLVSGRPEPLSELYEELSAGLRGVCQNLEFVFVVESIFNELAAPLLRLAALGEPISLVHVGQGLGEAALLREGFKHCRSPIIVTLPPRRRVETTAIAKLVQAVESGADMAVAARTHRTDSMLNRLQSRVFHALIGRALGPQAPMISDATSGVRAMRREILERLPLYGSSARFLPMLAGREGYRVVEVPALQHSADQRRPFPSPVTYLRSLFDLLSLFVVLRFTERPLRFFGLVGTATLLPGAAILAVLLVQKLGGMAVADRPLLLLGVLFVALGIQFIALGLVGEIIVHLHALGRRSYRLRE
jgi:hypothetical protein